MQNKQTPQSSVATPSPKSSEVRSQSSQLYPSLDFSSSTPRTIDNPLEEALKISVPSWPLQNTVAVNPFWNLRERSFHDVMSHLENVLHQPLLMPISYFRQKYTSGEISPEALSLALEHTRIKWPHLPDSVPELLQMPWGEAHFGRHIKTIAEITPNTMDLQDFVISEIGKFASAYYDERQALIPFPWQNLSFWQAWQRAQARDKAMSLAGFSKFQELLAYFSSHSPEEAIQKALEGMHIKSSAGQFLYLQRAITTVLGWASRFRYDEWQQSLGYDVRFSSRVVELLAVRVLYDYGIYCEYSIENEALYNPWADALNAVDVDSIAGDEMFAVLYTWQMALEFSYQRQVVSHLVTSRAAPPVAPRYNLVFCIDVRSEMIRRHFESLGEDAKTSGFAGFFGVAIDYRKCDEKSVGHRLPVLLKPAVSVTEDAKDHFPDTEQKLTAALTGSYFRSLRKAPLSSFLFVELFGILSIVDLIKRSTRALIQRIQGKSLPSRFDNPLSPSALKNAVFTSNQKALSLADKVSLAANSLKNMGLLKDFGRLILLVGHGAETSHNAFGSALDCGACGGHAGDINARFLAKLLNDSEIRVGLSERKIFIPDTTWFVAALHETVTDEVHILEGENVPQSFQKDLTELKVRLLKASQRCRRERQTARSHCLDSSVIRRSTNWAEVRPEWGLSGNACFIVAPRHRTKGVNLSSRAFLHDYDWQTDEGFQILELIMTAPMVVTNWINMQYYASVVAPRYYGSGSKTLHNLTNESGVFEGNGGDLRVGLPLQSVHDGDKFVHDPVRLSVFIEAPLAEIEKIIEKHKLVRDLISQEWLHIIQLESDTNRAWRRLSHGSYTEIIPY